MLGRRVGSYTSGMLLLSALTLSVLFAGPAPQDVKRALREVLSDERIQSEFPGQLPAEMPRQNPPGDPGDPGDLGALGAFAEVVLWVLLGVGGVLLIVALAQRLAGYTKDVRIADPPTATPAPVASPGLSLGAAESLAAAGRYDEAIHALLLVVFQGLGREKTLAGSLTSREILDEVPLGAEARGQVEQLVGTVEISLFGGRMPGEADYGSALDSYRRFASAQGWAGA